MTSIFGLKHPQVPLGILVADRQTTVENHLGVPSGKYIGRKLWIDKNKNYCFGHSGTRDESMGELVQKLSEGDVDIEKVVSKGFFPELRKININRLGKNMPDVQNMSGLIMLTRYESEPKLYTCFPLGNVEERLWTCAGSGNEKINEYMQALSVISEAKNYIENSKPVNTSDVIRTGLEAVRRAQSQDIYSSGLDLITCTPEGIFDHYEDLGDDFGKKLKKIQRAYKDLKKK